MTPLYTWDYAALGMDRRPKPSPNLIARGYQVRDDYTPAPRDKWDKPKPIESYVPTPEGRAWCTRVENAWEARTSGIVWWRVSLRLGSTVLGLPGIHPEEAERDLRRLYGERGRLVLPTDGDTSPGNPRRLPKTWRPWVAVDSWIDCSEERGAIRRGAYMRPFGDPVDPGLAFAECAGEEIDPSGWDLTRSRDQMITLVRAIALLDIP